MVLKLKEARVSDGLELESHAFLPSPEACCAQTALPFWAKVIGRVRNTTASEVMIDVIVTLFDANHTIIESSGDSIIVDKHERGEFDVKLVEYRDNIAYYTIDVMAKDVF